MSKRRKNGEGAVIHRSDGRWEGRLFIGYDEKDNPKTKSVLAETKAECLKKLEVLREDQAKSSGKLPKQCSPDMSFGEWLILWYELYKKPALRPNTRTGYENSIFKHILPALGKLKLEDLTPAMLQKFYAELKSGGRLRETERFGPGLSDRSVRACHEVIRMALDRAVEERLLHSNPADACKLPPKHRKEMKLLHKDEIQRFLIQAKEEGFYEMAVLELSTRMRRGEICALQWDDLDLNTGALDVKRQVYRAEGELIISQPKTKSALRTVILPPTVLKILKERKRQAESKWIFSSPVNPEVPCSPDAVRKKLKCILEHAECQNLRFHDLRHTFATAALEHGMDVKTLSAIIGHVKSATTLNVYSHVTDQMRIQAAEKIDAGIGGCEARDADLSRLPSQEGNGRPARKPFEPYKGSRRKPGTGCLHQINDHLWEGKYAPRGPDGKRIHKNVYAATKEECEVKLQAMIAETNAENQQQ